ncbi:unnamed protein product [Prorocentrum cordatum]|uniref:Uncharacterized protein n=1 Tax=Prorocentrum cordatum TaxID=2364126 RepID=A0ABN9VF24_9DINO|nr:unnamed protein product [Polarella glacialis]
MTAAAATSEERAAGAATAPPAGKGPPPTPAKAARAAARAPWRIPLDSSAGFKGSGSASKPGEPPQAKARLRSPPARQPLAGQRSKSPRPPAAADEDEGEAAAAGAQGLRRKRRGGRRARRGAHNDKVWSSKDKNLLSLLRSTLKLLLQTTHKTRLNSSIGIDTYTMSSKHPVIDGITNELEGYKQLLDQLRRSGEAADKARLKEIGSPAPALGLAALESLQKCDIGGSLKAEIATYLEKVQPLDPDVEVEISKDDLQTAISFIRLESCFDTDKMKLIIGAPTWEGRLIIQKALASEGSAQHHRGVAPAGWLEEEVAHWLETLEQ